MEHMRISDHSPKGQQISCSQVIRKGQWVYIGGTHAMQRNGEIVGKDDPYRQTIQVLSNIEYALKKVGATLTDVVRTRIYVTNLSEWPEISQAYNDFFDEAQPVTTIVEVNKLILPGLLVEIEAEAVINERY
ncbi:Rid family hydrolase [Hazenella coriacea]|uniref:Enamine deaminase RidA (YjgF/YER057c/UK114 family) n=1 Tax=Hazenella coriacea TaxID=1179467 RepID=A0A4R3LB64_9BACL|nr:Rid family hydrolase [Hazenella coriacea]TCS96425.1 enamine deaminase RidA (YjgF/YER057c/UK114 family) [Hazenella coriacea]